MDPKKQNLTPELKQIYDRVMNTQANPQTTPNAAQTPGQAPTTTPGSTAPTSPLGTTPPSTPIMPAPNAPVSGIPTSTPNSTPGTMAPNQPFLSSVPPRPVTDDTKPFVFNGKAPAGANQTKGESKLAGLKKIPMPVIAAGAVVLIIVYGVICAKLFGLI